MPCNHACSASFSVAWLARCFKIMFTHRSRQIGWATSCLNNRSQWTGIEEHIFSHPSWPPWICECVCNSIILSCSDSVCMCVLPLSSWMNNKLSGSSSSGSGTYQYAVQILFGLARNNKNGTSSGHGRGPINKLILVHSRAFLPSPGFWKLRCMQKKRIAGELLGQYKVNLVSFFSMSTPLISAGKGNGLIWFPLLARW